MKTVLFMGAGVSGALGYPLTGEILPIVRQGLRSERLFEDPGDPRAGRRNREELRRCLESLLPGLARVPEEHLPPVTDVLWQVERADAAGEPLPVGGDFMLRRFRNLLKQAVAEALENPLPLFAEGDTLERLLSWVSARGKDLSIVTTSYDVALESEIYSALGRDRLAGFIDLGFDWREPVTGREHPRPANAILRIFKLHGSLSYFRCRSCGSVLFDPWSGTARRPRDGFPDGACSCGAMDRPEIHIVSRSYLQNARDACLLGIWRRTFDALRAAGRWVIVGYSLPPEDLEIRSMLLRAYAGAPHPPEITVVQKSDREWSRYELLFPECRFETTGLEGFLAREAARSARSLPGGGVGHPS